MQYQEITCKDFNKQYGTMLTPGMTYYVADIELCEIIDETKFYMDMQPEAPISYMNEMHGDGYCDIKNVRFWHITDLGMYLAIMNN